MHTDAIFLASKLRWSKDGPLTACPELLICKQIQVSQFYNLLHLKITLIL